MSWHSLVAPLTRKFCSRILYLMETCGYDEASSRSMVRGKGSTRTA